MKRYVSHAITTNQNLKKVSRSFSALEHKDKKELIPGGCVGSIEYHETRNIFESPEYFFPQLLDHLDIVERGTEEACRIIISHYLTSAVKIARKKHSLPRIIYRCEHIISPEYIANVGNLSGVLDFAVARIKGDQTKPLGDFPSFTDW
jgi:hypothetical protein